MKKLFLILFVVSSLLAIYFSSQTAWIYLPFITLIFMAVLTVQTVIVIISFDRRALDELTRRNKS
jgi:hypothetical protein